MIVQRLTRSFRRLIGALFHPRSANSLASDRSTLLAAALRGESGASTKVTSSSWLDDGRRLRPHPSPPARLDQRWISRSTGLRQPSPAQPERGSLIRSTAEQPIGEKPKPVPTEPAAQQHPAPARPAQSEAIPPASPPSSDAEDQIVHQRLMALKRLVRLGIYNEGFDLNRVPEQYLHSLGREDDFGADSLE